MSYDEEVWLHRDCSSVIQVSIRSRDEPERDIVLLVGAMATASSATSREGISTGHRGLILASNHPTFTTGSIST